MIPPSRGSVIDLDQQSETQVLPIPLADDLVPSPAGNDVFVTAGDSLGVDELVMGPNGQFAVEKTFFLGINRSVSTIGVPENDQIASIFFKAAPVDHFLVSTPAKAVAGNSFSVTITVKDQYGNAVTGYDGSVRFTSSDGAAILPANLTLTGGVGTFNVTLESLGNETITVGDTANASLSGTSFSITVDAPLAAQGVTVATTKGIAFNGTVATFTDTDPIGAVGDFSATIDWGDGVTTSGTVTQAPDGGFVVSGSHTYSEVGAETVTVTIQDRDSAMATTASSADVARAVPVITWNNPADITYGDALGAVQLDATANVPGAFSYTLANGMAGASGAVLHAGTNQTLHVAFTPSDTTDYTTATGLAEINVDPATLTVTADDKSKVYGAALPTLTASYSGFVNGDTSANLTTPPSLSTTATASSHVSGNPYSITASGAVDADYTISYMAGTLTVTPAALGITADDKSKVYGAALPTLTASYSGFVNGDTSASLTTPPNLSTTATANSHVTDNPYSITASGAVDADYTISYVAGTLTVTPAALTITADDKNKVYGAALPTLTASYSGFVNGDTSASLTTRPSLSTTATASSHVSGNPYSVTASGAVDSDYTISYVRGTLTLTPATLTVAADDKAKQEGTANPTLTYTITGFVNGDSPNAVSGDASISTTANAASAAGTYPIVVAAGALAAADYTFAFQNGTLTITVNAQGAFAVAEDVYVIGTGTISVSAANGVLANDRGTGQLTVTPAIATGGEGGTFAFNADGSFTYTPPNNFAGFDYANYTARDGQGDQGTSTVNVLGQPAGVIWKFFEQVLHRDPAPTDLAFFIPQLAQYGSGVLSADFFESDELLNQLITGFYQQYLGRAPQGTDLSFWEGKWRAYGGPELIIAQFASSAEFNTLASNQYGAGPDGWVTALYERILNRVPRPGIDVPFWVNALDGGTTEGQVALDFVASNEGFGDDVTGWFQEYLGRAPTAAEQTQYVNQMLSGASDRTIEEAITSLPEYANNPAAPPAGTGVPLPDYLPAKNTAKTQAAADAVFGQLA